MYKYSQTFLTFGQISNTSDDILLSFTPEQLLKFAGISLDNIEITEMSVLVVLQVQF